MEQINILKNKVINILKNNYIYIIGVFVFTYKAILLNYMLNMSVVVETCLIAVAIPTLMLTPFISKKGKKPLIFINILYALITLLIYANYLYYSYSTNFLSVFQISNLGYAKEIGAGILQLIDTKILIIFWIDNVIWAVLSYLIVKKAKSEALIVLKQSYLKGVVVLVALIININLYNNIIDKAYSNCTYNRTIMIERIGAYYYHVGDLKEYIGEKLELNEVDYESITVAYQEIENFENLELEYCGIAEGKNLIILQLESLHEYVINATINGQEITPNLNRFYNENIYCTNMYNQGLGTTADSEHSMSTSLYPLENGQVFQKYFDNTWYSIYYDLQESGYYTSFMHPNVNTFWNRYEMYNTGYKVDEYLDIDSFDDKGESLGEYFSDELFLTQAVDILKTYEEPFAVTLVSVTTHIPFSLTDIAGAEDKVTLDLTGIEDEQTYNYFKCCYFTDYAFGLFLEALETSGLAEDTVLVVYGDHGASITGNQEIIDIFENKGIEYTDTMQKLENVHVPFGIRIPGLNEKLVITEAVSKIDVKPTIASIFGIQDTFSLGESIFSGKDYSFIKGLGFVTSNVYYVNGTFIDRASNQVIEPTDELEDLIERMNSDIKLSDSIIKSNYFRNHFNLKNENK